MNRDLDRLVQALLDGVPGSRVKDRMAALEVRKAELEALLADAVEEPVLLHPNMAEVYRAKIARLADALHDEHERSEATEIIRGLIDRIVLTPKDEDGRRSLSIDLEKGARRGPGAGCERQEAAGGQRPLGNNVGCGGLQPPTVRLSADPYLKLDGCAGVRTRLYRAFMACAQPYRQACPQQAFSLA